MTDSRGRDTAALFAWDLGSGRQELMADDARADVGELLRHPAGKRCRPRPLNTSGSHGRVLDN